MTPVTALQPASCDADATAMMCARLFAAALALLLGALPARAQVAGGGPKDTDCLTEFVAPANQPAGHPRKIRCVDNDPSCDADPTPGVCQFPVDVCFNVVDPGLPACAPRELEFYTVDNVQPDTDPRHDFEFQTLEDAAGAFVLPLTEDETDRCTGAVTMILTLPVRVKSKGAKWKKAKETLRTTAIGPGTARDEDTLKMTCKPAKGSDACAGITSTFQEIQEHVFDRSCNRQTCHNAGQTEHTLALAPGASWLNLVNAPPDDGTAFAQGKLRVDPGNPANSYLLNKLRGDLLETQGLRMPRELPRLPKKTIRMIEEWIQAGAPTTGFVSSVGCQPPDPA